MTISNSDEQTNLNPDMWVYEESLNRALILLEKTSIDVIPEAGPN